MITGLVSWVIISTFHIGWITAKKKRGKFKLQYIQYTERILKESDQTVNHSVYRTDDNNYWGWQNWRHLQSAPLCHDIIFLLLLSILAGGLSASSLHCLLMKIPWQYLNGTFIFKGMTYHAFYMAPFFWLSLVFDNLYLT